MSEPLKPTMPVKQKLLDTLTAQVKRLEAMIVELRVELRGVRRRLARYETAPPMFPAPMLNQIRLLWKFGVTEGELAQLYGIDRDRVGRIIAETEVPLIVGHTPPVQPRPKRAIRL